MNTATLRRAFRYIFQGVPRPIVKADIHLTTPSSLLSGEKVVITGGGSGLGYAMAEKFIQQGAEVLIAGRNLAKLEDAAHKLNCECLQLDVTETAAFESFVTNASKRLKGITTLVNNAGVSLHETGFLGVTPAGFDQQLNTNLRGAYFLSQEFIRYLLRINQKGNVLIISSERGFDCDVLPYGLSKAAINSLVQGLAKKYLQYNIRINGIAPGVTASEMTRLSGGGDLSYDWNPSGRYYLPQEVAEVATFIISPLSSCLNGQILVCNQGKTLSTVSF